MSRFLNPFPQFLKLQNGALQPNSDGTLTFYVNNSNTLASVYTDVGLSIAASNPQTLDSNGRMTQNVFLTTDTYRVALKDSNGATIWDKNDFAVADSTDIAALLAELQALIDSITSDLFSDNYVANGGFSVDDSDTANTPISLTTGYVDTVTGFASACLNNVSGGSVKQSTTVIGQSGFSMLYQNVTCTSAGVPAIRYRIASQDAASLSNKTVTLSLVVKHNVGAAVNYTISTYYANVKDNFAAVTTTGVSSVTSVTSGTATTISLTGDLGDVSNGLEVIISCAPNQALTTKNFYWSDVQALISGVLLPFHPPIYRVERYKEIDPDTVVTQTQNIATLAESVTGTTVTKVTTPGRQKYNPLHPKSVAAWSLTGGLVTEKYKSGCTLAYVSTGKTDVTLSPAMATANYVIVPHCSNNGTNVFYCDITNISASGFRVECFNVTGAGYGDAAYVSFSVFGALA